MYAGAVFDMISKLDLIGMTADVVIDVSGVVMLDNGVGKLADAEIILVTALVITFEFIITASYAVAVLAGVWSSAISGGAPSIGTEVNASRVAAVMTAVEFAMRAPWEDALLRC